MVTVLIVDDEPNIRRMLASLLRAEGMAVREADSVASAIEAVRAGEPDVLLMDLVMPGTTGLDALPRMAEAAPDMPIVMMSARASLSDAVPSMKPVETAV